MFNRLLASDAIWNWFALEIALKGTLLLLLAGGIVLLLGRSSAAVRHRVWSLLFVGLLLLPLIHLVLPGLSWQIIPDRWQPAETKITAATADADSRSSRPNMPSATQYAVRASEPIPAKIDNLPATRDAELTSMDLAQLQEPSTEAIGTALSAVHQTLDENAVGASVVWLPFIWLLGMVLAVLPLLTGLLGNLRLRHHSRPPTDSEWPRLVDALSHRLDLRRNVTLLCGGSQQMPMTFGLLRSCVVLPSSAEHWSAERRQIVLLHELAHVKRCDVPLQLIARLAAAIYWFHPLVWWALRRMRLEREHACDDCVLQAGQEAPDYATQLLEIARTHCSRTPILNAALSMARPSQLEGRLLAVLDTHRRRDRVGRAAAFQLGILALALVVCLGLVRPTVEAQTAASLDERTLDVTSKHPDKPASETVLTGRVLSPEGKPVPDATVEVIAYDSSDLRRNIPHKEKIDRYETQTDAAGKFRLAFPRDISRPRESMKIFAGAHGYALNQVRIEPTVARRDLEIKLQESKLVRLQLIDAAGNPVANVQPQIRFMTGIWTSHRHGHLAVSTWPQCSRRNEEGYVSVAVPMPTKQMSLVIDDERVGAHRLEVSITDEPISVALRPARFLNGKVTAADTGDSIADAEVFVMEEPYRRIRTSADGRFRIAGGTTLSGLFPDSRTVISVYPPSDSSYLLHALEWQWPNEGIGDAELAIQMERGIVVEGQIVEKETGDPVRGATIWFDPQDNDNPFFRRTAKSNGIGSDMKYLTDEEGRFRLPVWPGPGYVLAQGPTRDFLHDELSMGDRIYGKTGLSREYYGASVRLNLEPGKSPQPITIELERGVTLRRRVLRPDGKPAEAKAYARSYLPDGYEINGSLPGLPVERGLLELPGFEPKRSNPLFIVDFEQQCGAVVSPKPDEVGLGSPPIQLERCGAAKFRFVTDKGKALAAYQPRLLMIITPGAPDTHYISPNQPLWADSVFWDNIEPEKIPTTDADGRVTVDRLIPGATYRVSFIGKGIGVDEGYEFTVRSGETVDVGEVVIPERN
ncbi:MAG: M56 family metallopeptidase [Pirellulales bacterium]